MRLVLLQDLHFICLFIDAIKSESLTLIFQSDIVRIWAHIELSPFYYTPSHQSIYHTYPTLPIATTYSLTVHQKCTRNEGYFIFFRKDWEKKNKKHFHSVKIGNDILIYINKKTNVLDGNWLLTLLIKHCNAWIQLDTTLYSTVIFTFFQILHAIVEKYRVQIRGPINS